MRPPMVAPHQTRYFNQMGGMAPVGGIPPPPMGQAPGGAPRPAGPPPVPVLSEELQQKLLEEKVRRLGSLHHFAWISLAAGSGEAGTSGNIFK